MAEDTTIGLKIVAETDSFDMAMKKTKENVKQLGANFKEGVAGLDRWSQSTDGLNKKIDSLNGELTQYKAQMDATKKKIAELEAMEGDHSKEIENKRKVLQQANTKYQETQQSIRKYTKDLKELQKTEKSGFGSKLKKGLEDVSKAGQKALKTIGKLSAGVGALGGAFLATASSTREFRTNMGKIDVAFEDSGFSAEQARDTYKEFYGVLGDEGKATEAVSHLAKLANNQEDLAKWTDIATGVYASFGDSLPIEGLTEASNETAKTGKLTGVLADALNWAGVNEDEFQKSLDNCNNESERQALITDTLVGKYKNASKQYKETNKDIIASNKAQTDLSTAMADLGKQAEPLMTSLTQLGTTALQAFSPIIEQIIPKIQENLPQIIAVVAGLVAVFGALAIAQGVATVATNAYTVAMTAWNAITKAVTAGQWLLNTAMSANPIGLVILAIAGLVTAFVLLWNKSEAFRNFWIGLWDKIKEVASSAWEGITGLWSDFDTWMGEKFGSAWELVKGYWSTVGDYFATVWETIKGIFSVVGSVLSGDFSEAGDKIKSIVGLWSDFFSDTYEKIKGVFSTVGSWFSDKFSEAWNGVKSAWSGAVSFFSDIWEKIKSVFSPSQFKEIGKNLIDGLKNGIESAKDSVVNKAKDVGSSIVSGVKNLFGVHSPSTVFAEIGRFLMEGLSGGIEGEEKGVLSTLKGLGSKAVGTLKDALGKAGSKLLDKLGEALGIDFGKMFEKGTVSATYNTAKAMVKPIEEGVKQSSSALDKLTEYLKGWQEKAGKYISQVGGYFDSVTSKAMEMRNAMLDYQDQIAENQKSDLDKQLEKFKTANEKQVEDYTAKKNSEITAQEEATQKKLDALELEYSKGTIWSGEYTEQKQKLEQKLADFTKKKQDEIASYTEKKNAQVEAQEQKILKQKDDIARKQFEAQQKNDIAQTLINGASAIVKGFADLGPIGGAINAGVQAGITALQVKTIKAQKYVPLLAKGGIANGATMAMIGEAGKEAVLPLERNTGWMDELAKKLNAIMQKDLVSGVQVPYESGIMRQGNVSNVNNFTQVINAPKTPSRRELYRDSKNLLALGRA